MNSGTAPEGVRIVLNGLDDSVAEGTTIAALLVRMGITRERVAVELDGKVIRKIDYETRSLSEGSRVEVVSFTGGG